MSDGMSDAYKAEQEARDEEHLDSLQVLDRMLMSFSGSFYQALKTLESSLKSLMVTRTRERDAMAVLVLHAEKFGFDYAGEGGKPVVIERMDDGCWKVTRCTSLAEPVICDSLMSALSAMGDFETNGGQKVSSRGLRRVLHYVHRRMTRNVGFKFNLPWD
jgi:hypothetical protein